MNEDSPITLDDIRRATAFLKQTKLARPYPIIVHPNSPLAEMIASGACDRDDGVLSTPDPMPPPDVKRNPRKRDTQARIDRRDSLKDDRNARARHRMLNRLRWGG